MPALDLCTREAFEAFYFEHFRFVWRALKRFGVAADELEDACHDLFLIVHRRRFESTTWSSPRAWLTGVARRVAADRRRRQARRERKFERPRAPERSMDEQLDASVRVQRIAKAIDALPHSQREVYALVELEGLPAPGVAEALAIPINTVYSRLRRARAAIDRCLEGLDPDRSREP